MKNLFLAAAAVALSSATIFGQSAVEFNYSEIHIGRDVNLTYKYTFSDLAVYGGVGYFINRQDHIRGLFSKAGTARTLSERFGSRVGVELNVFQNEFCKIGVYLENRLYQMALTRKLYAQEYDEPAGPDDDYARGLHFIGTYVFCENFLGASIQAKLTPSVYLTTKGAFGIMYYKSDNGYVNMKSGLDYITSNFSIGLGYQFKAKTKA